MQRALAEWVTAALALALVGVACADSAFASAHLAADAPTAQVSLGDRGDTALTLTRFTVMPGGGDVAAVASATEGLRVAMSRHWMPGVVHYTAAQAPAHSVHRFGATFGRATFAYTLGEETGPPATAHPFNAVGENFFHGHTNRAYAYSGAAAGFDFTASVSGQLGSLVVRAPGLSDRLVQFAGIASPRFSAAMMDVRRDDEPVGRGLQLNLALGGGTVSYQQLRSVTDAVWHRAGVTVATGADTVFGFSVEQGRNPRYADGNDTRWLFTFRRSWGGRAAPLFRGAADEDGGEDTAGAHTSFARLGLIAGGAAAAAVALSSGDSDSDTAARFASQNEAARAALAGINPSSVRESVEYGGAVYRNPDGTFSHADPVRGGPHSVAFNPHAIVPAGTQATAAYHTHGSNDPGFLNEFFSPQDIVFFVVNGVDGYLGTPAGRMFYYQRARDTVFQLVDGANEFVLPN